MGMELNTFGFGTPQLDSLIVYVTSKVNTKIDIDNPRSAGSKQTFNIVANRVNRIQLAPTGYHPDTSSELISGSFSRMGLRIVAQDPVNVYTLALEQYRSSCTFVLPYDAIPKAPEFIITAFSPNVTKSAGNYSCSEFMIVAMDQNVEVEITPRVRTKRGRPAGTPFTVTLSRGQTYQVRSHQADGENNTTGTNFFGDLTGTTVKVINGCGKINVFTGNESVSVERHNGGGCGTSRDHIYCQALPTAILGKNFVTAPFYSHTSGYVYRVIAAEDNTTVSVDGTTVATLNKGQIYHNNVGSAVARYISCSKKAYCAQFMKNETCSGSSDGDPAMILLPDVTQTLNSAIVGTATTSSMRKHYLNIIIKQSAKNAVFNNSVRIPAGNFINLSYGGYCYTQVILANPSTNVIESDSGFISISYGYGDRESYAYCAGALFENLNYDIKVTQPNKCPLRNIKMEGLSTGGTIKAYMWDFGDGSKDTGRIVNYAYKTPGKYFVNLRIVIPGSCGVNDTIIRSKFINVFPGPTVQFPDTTTQCAASLNVRLDAGFSPKFTYVWNTGNTTRFQNVTTNGKYKVTVLDTSTNCAISDSTFVRLADTVKMAVTFDTINQCYMTNKFVIRNASTYNNDYQIRNFWSVIQKPKDTFSSQTATVTAKFDTTGTYKYRLIVWSFKGCKDTLNGILNVVHRPVAKLDVVKNDLCVNEKTKFIDSSSGPGGITKSYWDYADGGKKDTLREPYRGFAAHNTYRVQLITESSFGCRDTVDSLMTIHPKPIPAIKIISQKNCLKSNAFEFEDISSIPAGIWTNRWVYKNNQVVHKQSTLLGVNYTDTGWKTIKLYDTSDKGCIDSVSTRVYVAPHPRSRIAVTDSSLCFKNHFYNLNNTSTIGSNKTISKTWWKFSDATAFTTTSISNKKFVAAGTYSVTLITESSDGCQDSIKRTLVVHTSPEPSFAVNNSSQCLKNNSFTFTPNWVIPTGVSANHAWKFGNGNTSTTRIAAQSYADTGKYKIDYVVTTDKGCKDSATTDVFVIPAPTVDFNVNYTAACFDVHSFNFTNATVPPTGLTYLWTLGDNTTSSSQNVSGKKYSTAGSKTIKLVASTGGGCRDSVIKPVDVWPVPQAAFSINNNDTVQCINAQNFVFNNNSINNGASGLIWEWQIRNSGGNLPNITTQNIGPIQLPTVGKMFYKLKLTSDKGCFTETNWKSIEALDTPKISIIGNDACAEEEIDFESTLDANPNGGTGTYLWNFGNGNTSAQEDPTYSYNNAGNFTVKLTFTDAKGCKANATTSVQIFSLPVANFDFVFLGSKGFETDYKFISKSIGNTSQTWLLGDGQSFNANEFTTTFKDTGRMKALLLVSDNNGCTDSSVKWLFLKPELQMFLATGFSPNNDALNETWGPNTTYGLSKYRLQIYDRWGALIFKTDKPEDRWTGRYKNTGKMMPDGVYAYVMSFRYIDGKQFVYKGEITIIR